MKKEYTGLKAILIPFSSTDHILAQSGCVPVWTSHADHNNNLICDSTEGSSNLPSTQSWTACEIGDEEF